MNTTLSDNQGVLQSTDDSEYCLAVPHLPQGSYSDSLTYFTRSPCSWTDDDSQKLQWFELKSDNSLSFDASSSYYWTFSALPEGSTDDYLYITNGPTGPATYSLNLHPN